MRRGQVHSLIVAKYFFLQRVISQEIFRWNERENLKSKPIFPRTTLVIFSSVEGDREEKIDSSSQEREITRTVCIIASRSLARIFHVDRRDMGEQTLARVTCDSFAGELDRVDETSKLGGMWNH